MITYGAMRGRSGFTLLCVLAMVTALLGEAPDSAFSDNVGRGFDGSVMALATQPDSSILVSGSFSHLMPDTAFAANASIAFPLTMGVTSLVLGLAAQHLSPPPNLVTNGDARGGASGWERQRVPETAAARDLARDAFVETGDGVPCFVMRNKASWVQRIFLQEDYAGKFLLIIARGSSERVHADGNITGLPYLWAHLVHDGPASNANYLQGMILKSGKPDAWATMHGIFALPKGVRAMTLKLGQAERRGTPQNGSAARVTGVEMRLFDTRGAADTYVAAYTAFHDPK